MLSLAALGLLPFIRLGNGTDVPRLALFLGRFHPVVLHVPIGLILFAIILEHAHVPGLRGWVPKVLPGTTTFLLFFASASATLSTLLGWMLSYSGGYDPVLLKRHFYAGLATAIGANLALLFKVASEARPQWRTVRICCQALLLLSGASLMLAGHLGASITHGEDYLTEYAPDSLRHLLGLPVRVDPANLPWKPLPDRVAFDDVVAPILMDRCVSCHSGGKAKGDLRLDRYDLLLKGGSGGPAVVPSKPDSSPLIHFINLPGDDEKHMPPKGKTQLTDDEIAILEWWVSAGAPEQQTIGHLNVPADVQLAMENTVPEAIRKKQEAAQSAAAARVAAMLRNVRQGLHGTLRLIVPGQPDLEYAAGPDFARVDDAQVRLLAPLGDNIVSMDLARTRVTDAGAQVFEKMPGLRQLKISETAVGDAGLASIGKLKNLEVLNLYDTGVTDKGLPGLASLGRLRRIYLAGCKVTGAGIEALRKALPQAEIVQTDPVPRITPAPKPKKS